MPTIANEKISFEVKFVQIGYMFFAGTVPPKWASAGFDGQIKIKNKSPPFRLEHKLDPRFWRMPNSLHTGDNFKQLLIYLTVFDSYCW